MINLISAVAIAAISSQFREADTHNVVIEVNVPGSMAYQMVLGNVENLKKAFAPQAIQIEIVCEGHGINMLLSKPGPLADRVRKVQKLGVQFAACGNTVRAMHLDRSHLFPFVKVVDAGVAEVVRKQEAGWSYLKGAF